ncbi:hypothetical protein [Oceanobacillus sojae]|uniref:Uncharacterized protein n=1 Tax=Oceanobacillus sojae TaxID=582851 RepID=A0A511ZII9_9BACI|nr:hypothetical protein [Oceanobacillus sojae]GEN87261.1 hypothetical protein OSO01_20000 [Oceanobacillus sojae]
MKNKFKLDGVVKIIYFSNEEVDHHETIFDGDVVGWRNEVGTDWNGFGIGDRFFLNDDKVRVFKQDITTSEDGLISKAIYCIGPENLNPNNIAFKKLSY